MDTVSEYRLERLEENQEKLLEGFLNLNLSNQRIVILTERQENEIRDLKVQNQKIQEMEKEIRREKIKSLTAVIVAVITALSGLAVAIVGG